MRSRVTVEGESERGERLYHVVGGGWAWDHGARVNWGDVGGGWGRMCGGWGGGWAQVLQEVVSDEARVIYSEQTELDNFFVGLINPKLHLGCFPKFHIRQFGSLSHGC